jgi:hypothetical protein
MKAGISALILVHRSVEIVRFAYFEQVPYSHWLDFSLNSAQRAYRRGGKRFTPTPTVYLYF